MISSLSETNKPSLMRDYLNVLKRLHRPTLAVDLPQSLEPMQRLMSALGNPHLRFPAVVAAGSTGKGTTCARLAGALISAGRRTGLYTSPHLHLFRERFVIDGEKISQAEFVEAAAAVEAAARATGITYSTFEMATALACYWFAQREVEVAVLEVGLGGRFDAVNVVPNVLALITPVELEHAAMLGGTLDSIGWHKAGILQPGGRGITVSQRPEVLGALEQEAAAKNATLLPARDDRALVMAAWEVLMQQGIAPAGKPRFDAALPGRLELVQVDGQTVLIDGGHTPLAAARLRRAVDLLLDWEMTVRMIAGLLSDKDAGGYLSAFDARPFRLVLTRIPGHRGASPEALARAFQPTQAQIELVDSVEAALEGIAHARETVIVVAGSLRLAALAREHLGLLPTADLTEARETRAIFSTAGV